MSINSCIAEYILRAQNASDGGKNIDILVNNKRGYRDNAAGYGQKDRLILSAIELIRRNKSAFKYTVVRDKSHVADYIVYFETMIGYNKYQVSFHSFDSSLSKYVRNSFRTKWDRGNSRESAVCIYEWYCENGTYSGQGENM